MYAERPSGMEGVSHMTVGLACLRHLRLQGLVVRDGSADTRLRHRLAGPGGDERSR